MLDIGLNPNLRIYEFEGRFAWNVYRRCHVRGTPEELEFLMAQAEQQVHKDYVLEGVKDDERVLFARRAFRATGTDPARYRPSQEALMRRILKGRSVRLVNSAVDVNNVLSLRFRLAMGIYDAGKIEGGLGIKIGEPGDIYLAVNNRDVDGTGKFLLCDSRGPIGGPYVDSMRTSIQETGFYDLLHVVYLIPPEVDSVHLSQMRDFVARFLKGHGESYQIL